MKQYLVTVNGTKYEVTVELKEEAPAAPAPVKEEKAEEEAAAPAAGNGAAVNSPMPGTILDVRVTQGQSVKKGDVLFILEAMKMENEIMAPADGTVSAVSVKKGDAVASGAALCSIA